MAYGPMAIATVAYLAEHRVAEVVTTRDPALLETALRRFTGDPDYGRTLGARGRAFAFERHPVKAVRERLHASLSEAASQHGFAPGVKPRSSDDAGLCGCHSRRTRLTINEGTLVAEVLSGTSGGIVMAVGARAHDTLAPFLTGGFTVHALAPDPTTAVGAGPRARPEPGPGSADHVATTTVRELIAERRLSRVDLLMVDSPHLGILQDVPWAERRPRFVMCAFDEQSGYPLHDLTRLLVAQGYRVWVSEWHPPTRFGPKFMKAGRRWRRLVPYPCHLGSPRAWGYCIATRETADAEALAEAARRAIERPSPYSIDPMAGPDGSALRAEGSARGDEGQALGQGPDQPDPGRDRGLSRRSSSRCLGQSPRRPGAAACLSARARQAILSVSLGRTYSDIADPAAGAARRLRPARYWP